MAIPLRSPQYSLVPEFVPVRNRFLWGESLAVVEYDYEYDYEYDPEIIILSKLENPQKGCFSMWRNRT